MDAHVGRISHYRVLDELGRDRLGYVLRAQDEQLDRPVVLRIMRAASVYPADRVEAIRANFQSEARRAARVSHPNLATIYAFQPIDEVDLVAMEQVEGTSLRALLALGERWRVPDAARLVARVADAVAAAHAAGMTHGRLSLANVIVRPDGRVKVLDLGIPRAPAEPEGEGPAVPPVPADRADDVYALALITLELAATASLPPGALWRQIEGDAETVAAMLRDEAVARRRYGVLAPVVRRAIAPGDGDAYADAGEYRDALLAALVEPAGYAEEHETDEPHDADLGPGTPLVVPQSPPISESDDVLEDLSVGPGAEPDVDRAPRLVLTADLAKGGRPPPSADTYVVMGTGGLGARLREARGSIGGGGRRLVLPEERVSRTAVVRIAVVLVLLAAAALIAWRVMSTDGGVDALLAQAEPIAERVRDRVRDAVSTRDPAATPDPNPTEVRPPAADSLDPDGFGADTGRDPSAMAGTATPGGDTTARSSPITPTSREPAPGDAATPSVSGAMRTAMVRVSPPGTSIRVDGLPGTWENDTQLAVADGDSLIVRFERPGYVAETHVFRGSRLSVSLRPDSVMAHFAANVSADVYIEHADGARTRIGTTDFSRRMPAGSHRIVFIAPGQTEWVTDERMTRAGETYRVEKLDYVTEGSLVATTTPTWAWVSVDGGPPRETPVRIEGLSVGTHTITITRDGFAPIADSVVIPPGYVVTKRYTLARR